MMAVALASVAADPTGPFGLTVALLLVAAGALVVVLQQITSPSARTRRAGLRVHRQLAAANGLDAEQTAFLWQLARAVVPDQPCLVFVRPSLLDGAAATAPEELVRSIRTRLFDG